MGGRAAVSVDRLENAVRTIEFKTSENVPVYLLILNARALTEASWEEPFRNQKPLTSNLKT